MGTNNLWYKHIYYIAQCNPKCNLVFDDNNISGTNNFAKIMFVFPARETTPAASTDFLSEKPFVQGDMSLDLLSIVRRSNKQAIESEGTGVVITRLN